MLDITEDAWLAAEISKFLPYIDVAYIASRCTVRRLPNGRDRYVFRPREDLGDIKAHFQPWKNSIQLSWPSASINETGRVGLYLDSADFSFDANGIAYVNKSLAEILDAKFGHLNWAPIESRQSKTGGNSGIQVISKAVEDYWPLMVDDTKRHGACRGITNDILRGISVDSLLQDQRRRNERSSARRK